MLKMSHHTKDEPEQIGRHTDRQTGTQIIIVIIALHSVSSSAKKTVK